MQALPSQILSAEQNKVRLIVDELVILRILFSYFQINKQVDTLGSLAI
jgi:hypothetical protein